MEFKKENHEDGTTLFGDDLNRFEDLFAELFKQIKEIKEVLNIPDNDEIMINIEEEEE